MDELVKIRQDRAVTTSVQVAEMFHKQHRHVLRDIESLDCSAEFRKSNFGRYTYLLCFAFPGLCMGYLKHLWYLAI